MSYAVARRRGHNGEINKLYPEDRAVHEWYRFVLSFPPHLVRGYLQRFGIGQEHQVLDPFCGTGTVLVECKKLGIPSIGVEANPMAHFAGQVKVSWEPAPEGLVEHATRTAHMAVERLARDGIDDDPLFRLPPRDGAALRRLPPETAGLLLAGSISPLPLHKTLVLLDCLSENRDERYDRHERLALAKALVTSIGNLHFGPEVGVGTAKPDAPVITPWLAGVRAMADDLRKVGRGTPTPAVVHHADARRLGQVLEPRTVDAVITSPPYPNEKDYTRTTRLESVLLGFIASKADLRTLKQGLVRSNTRGVYTGDDDDRWVAEHPEIQRIAAAIEARRIKLGKTSGFERLYARVTRRYCQASYLRVMVRTGQILADIAQSLGYEVVDIDLFRTRLATATGEQLREEVVVLRWLGSGVASAGGSRGQTKIAGDKTFRR
jgi:hypothetical protein